MAAPEQRPVSRTIDVRAVSPDGEALEQTTTIDVRIRTAAGLSAAQTMLPNNEHFATLEILEAATVKPDGRRVDVARNAILVAGLPNSPQLGVFQADVRTHTVVFPDVAVGDVLHLVTRSRTTMPLVAGGFSIVKYFPFEADAEAVSVTLDVPDGTPVQAFAVSFESGQRHDAGRSVWQWRMTAPSPATTEPGAVVLRDDQPLLVVSSHRSWESVGRELFRDFDRAGQPDDRLKALALDITKDAGSPREKAAAVSAYVARTIRYFLVQLGRGGLKPHDAAAVLDAKYGDCKDHAVLTAALLSAVGIRSQYAAIEAGPTYRHPEVPAVEWFNHVILYLPDLDVYVDPTNPGAAFGHLSRNEYDKPVLLLGEQARLARTPPLAAQTNTLEAVVTMKVGTDGGTQGRLTVTGSGASANDLRWLMQAVATRGGEAVARDRMTGMSGTGSVDLTDPYDLREPYAVSASFSLTTSADLTDGLRPSLAIGPRVLVTALSDFQRVRERSFKQDFVCQAQSVHTIWIIEPPEGFVLRNKPPGTGVSVRQASYASRSSYEGGVLRVERTFMSTVEGSVCRAADVNDMRAVLDIVAREATWRPHFVRADK